MHNLNKKLSRDSYKDFSLENYIKNGSKIPTEDQLKQIKLELANYNELFEKAKNKFEQLKGLSQNEVKNKGKSENEKTFISGILEILAFADSDDSTNKENTLKRIQDLEENANKENQKNQAHPGTGNFYVIYLPAFLEIFYPPHTLLISDDEL